MGEKARTPQSLSAFHLYGKTNENFSRNGTVQSFLKNNPVFHKEAWYSCDDANGTVNVPIIPVKERKEELTSEGIPFFRKKFW